MGHAYQSVEDRRLPSRDVNEFTSPTSKADHRPGPAGRGSVRNLDDPTVRLRHGPDPKPWVVLLFVGIHTPLALAMQASPAIAQLHAVATVVMVLWLISTRNSPVSVAMSAGYVAGCEVMWRATSAGPWEASKYLLIVIFAIGTMRFAHRLRGVVLPVVLVGALVPAALITVLPVGPFAALDPLAFNLAGLVALALGVIFFSQFGAGEQAVRSTLWSVVAPCVGLATLAASGAASLTASDFTTESNFAASGGFGPNQVSAVLGLGALFCFFLTIRENQRILALVAACVGPWFVAQTLLTFSRGGMLNLVLALLVTTPFLLTRHNAARSLAGFAVFVAVCGLVILPRLNAFTGGALELRYHDPVSQDSRRTLADEDLGLFESAPLVGVGVGGASDRRSVNNLDSAAHTEYSRLLAEHGLLGLLVIVCLAGMALQAFRRQPSNWGRAWSTALVVWTATEMAHGATRMAVVPFAFALATLTMLPTATPRITEDQSTS